MMMRRYFFCDQRSGRRLPREGFLKKEHKTNNNNKGTEVMDKRHQERKEQYKKKQCNTKNIK
jgi:hypothetical protein